jgi:hypothetical protein
MSKVSFGPLSAESLEEGLRVEIPSNGSHAAAELCPRDAGALASFITRQRWDESRTGFRVPVHALPGDISDHIRVTLVHNSTIYDCEAVDISLTGMLVRCGALRVGANTRVDARILLDEHLARLAAEVVRADGSVLALHFLECMHGGELRPPQDLVALFRRLEQVYLRLRREADSA